MEVDYEINRFVSLDAMASIGNWRYTDNITAGIFDLDNNQALGEETLYAKDLKIGDAAQTTFNLGVSIKPIKGLLIHFDAYHAANLYAEFNITENEFFSPDPELAKLPAYTLLDGRISYNFNIGKIGVRANFNMNNMLDTEYIAELDTNIQDDPTTDNDELLNNKGFYGFGRTWSAGLKFTF